MKGGVAFLKRGDEYGAVVVLTVVARPLLTPLFVLGYVSSSTPLFFDSLFCFPSYFSVSLNGPEGLTSGRSSFLFLSERERKTK